MKVARAEETAQRKLDWLAEKQQKADKRAAKAAEKAAQGAVVMGEVMEEVLGKGKDRFKVGGVVPKQECPGHFRWSYQVSQVAAALETMRISPIVVPESPPRVHSSPAHPTMVQTMITTMRVAQMT